MDPREAVRQGDFYQTKVKASQQLQINQIIDKVKLASTKGVGGVVRVQSEILCCRLLGPELLLLL